MVEMEEERLRMREHVMNEVTYVTLYTRVQLERRTHITEILFFPLKSALQLRRKTQLSPPYTWTIVLQM